MMSYRLLSIMVLLLCLTFMPPLSAGAEEEYPESVASPVAVNEPASDEEMHPTLSYGKVRLHDFYGEQWDGWSLGLSSYAFVKKYFGLSLGYHGIEARTDERDLEGRYTSNGIDMLFLFSTKMNWLRPYAGLGAGAHYNYINVKGKKEFERSGYGFSLIGEAGLRVVALNFKAFGKPAKLVFGGYGRYFYNKEYFYDNDFNNDQADFPGNEYGAHLGLALEM